MRSIALIAITFLPPIAFANTAQEYSCSYSNKKADIYLFGPCTITDTNINGHFGYIFNLKGHSVSIEYVDSDGPNHSWKINGAPGVGIEITREHLQGSTADLNQSIEWLDRPDPEANQLASREPATSANLPPTIIQQQQTRATQEKEVSISGFSALWVTLIAYLAVCGAIVLPDVRPPFARWYGNQIWIVQGTGPADILLKQIGFRLSFEWFVFMIASVVGGLGLAWFRCFRLYQARGNPSHH